MIISRLIKTTAIAVEYACFSLSFCYWFFYSLARIRGVPVLFAGIQVNSLLSSVIVLVLLGFNAIFFSRLFLELVAGPKTLRVRLAMRFFDKILPISLVLFLIAYVTGGRFDYASYKLQWGLIIGGGNPWGHVQGGMVNAYGYVFNFLAALYSANSLLPKLFFVLMLLVFCWRLIMTHSSVHRALVVFLCVNPFTVSTIAVYGFIDGLCSLLLGFALMEGNRDNLRSSFKSGTFIALSILTKFYSLAALPVLLIANLRSRSIKAFGSGFLLASIIILPISYILWGNTILAPLLFAQGRDPSFLTLWKYVSHPEWRTVIFSFASVLAIAIACKRQDLSCSYRTAAVLSIVFGAYYLGHQQFYLGIFVSIVVYIIEVVSDPNILLRKPVLWSFALMFGWLIFIQTGFELFDEFKPVGFQSLLPILSFLNSALLVGSGCYWLSTKPTLTLRTRVPS